MARTVPSHWFRGGARPLELEPPTTVAPSLSLETVGPPQADGPQPFGRKCRWLAVRAEEGASVLQALGIVDSARCGWAEGIAIVHREEQVVFVTPPIRGRTLVVAPLARFHDESDGLQAHLLWLRVLSERLGEVQAFESHRGSAHFAWSLARDGEVLRAYRYSECPAWSVGKPTAGEPCQEGEPDEESVLAVARAWGVDPDALVPSTAAPATGTLGLLPPTAVRVWEPTEYQKLYPEEPIESARGVLRCRVYWNPTALRLGYEFEPITEGEDGRLWAGRRRHLSESAEVPRIAKVLRQVLGRSAQPAPSEAAGGRGRKSPSWGDSRPRARGAEVVVEVEQVDGALVFWPTRRRWGRVRRHDPGRLECRWVDRAGIVAWSLDQAIVRSMELRPLWRMLVEVGERR